MFSISQVTGKKSEKKKHEFSVKKTYPRYKMIFMGFLMFNRLSMFIPDIMSIFLGHSMGTNNPFDILGGFANVFWAVYLQNIPKWHNMTNNAAEITAGSLPRK
jgi:hypothetical protein